MRLSQMIERLERDRSRLTFDWYWTQPPEDPRNQEVLRLDRAVGQELAQLQSELIRLGDREMGDASLAAGAKER